MTVPHAAFTGYYGMRNFGDDLFGVLCTRAAQRYWAMQPLLIGPQLVGMAGTATMPAFYPRDWYGALGPLGKGSRWLSFVGGILRSDILVMGGGSVITARESFRKPIMQWARRHRGIRLAAVGVSIGPFANEHQEADAASFLDGFSYLSVRDRRSYEWVQRMGLSPRSHAGCDLAALLPVLGAVPMKERRDEWALLRLGVAPCNYSEDDGYAPSRQAWSQAIVEIARRRAATRPLAVEVFSLNEHPRHGDAAIAQTLCEQLRAAGVETLLHRYTDPDPLRMIAAIARCDAMISARLHGAIVSYLCRVPFVIVDYHRKCRDFADDIGLPRAFRISREDGEPFSDVITALLDDARTASSSPHVYANQAEGIFQCAPWAKQRATG